MTKKFRLMGCNDDFDTCSCCGRTGLKRVVMLAPQDADGGLEDEPAPYGTSCAARMLGYTFGSSAKERRQAGTAVEQEALSIEVQKLQEFYTRARETCVVSSIKRSVNQFGAPIVTADVDGCSYRLVDRDDHDQPLTDAEIRRRVALDYAASITYAQAQLWGSLTGKLLEGFCAATKIYLYRRFH